MRTHVLDILLFGLLAFAAYTGWRKGLVVELLNTVGLLVGVVAGFMLHDVVAGLLGAGKAPSWAVKIFAFAVTAVVVWRLWAWLAKAASSAFRLTALGMADQFLGAVLGLVKASLLVSAVFWLAGLLHLKTLRSAAQESYLAADVVQIGNAEFYLLSQAAPLFSRWYNEARAHALDPRPPQP